MITVTRLIGGGITAVLNAVERHGLLESLAVPHSPAELAEKLESEHRDRYLQLLGAAGRDADAAAADSEP